jgi:hypothetical protein
VLVEGKNRVRVYQPEGPPLVGFEPVEATLEDAYLLLMQDAAPAHRMDEEAAPALAAGGAA